MSALLVAALIALAWLSGFFVGKATIYQRLADGFWHMESLSLGRDTDLDAPAYSAREVCDAFGSPR